MQKLANDNEYLHFQGKLNKDQIDIFKMLKEILAVNYDFINSDNCEFVYSSALRPELEIAWKKATCTTCKGEGKVLKDDSWYEDIRIKVNS